MKFIKFKVTDTQVEILEKSDKIPSGNVEYIKCEFDIDSVFDGLVMRASFNGEYRPIVNNMCYAPALDTGPCKIGVYGYRIENNQYKLVISPQPTNVIVSEGSYSPEHTQAEMPQPSELEAFYTQIENLIMSNKNGNDYTKLKNIPIRLIDLAEFKDRRFNFDEQITEPGLYKCVSSDDNGVVDAYIRENDAEPVGHLTAMDFFNVLYVNDNTTDGYQATLIFLSSERFIHFLNLSSHSNERSTCFQYPFINDDMLNTDRLSTFSGAYIMEILLDMSQNESENMDSIRQQLMLLIEQQQSKTEQKFTDVNKSIDALSESVNQEYLSRVDIEDVRIYTDENGNNKFQFDNATLTVTATGGNSYISDYIPITEKLQITGYAVQNTTMANGIAFVTYDSDKQPIQAYRGDTEISTFVYEKTAVITPEEAAFVRIRSRDNYNSRVKSKATVERFVGAKEKIEEMQAQLDSLLGLTAAAYAAEE